MRARYHVVASAGISLGLQAAMHSWPASLGCFFSGILIDTDHVLEYCLIKKKPLYRYRDLVEFSYTNDAPRVYLVFHTYEFLFILWSSIYFFSLGKIWTGIAVGLTAHLVFDQFTNPIKPLFYFVTFRAIHHFEKANILSEKYFQRCKLKGPAAGRRDP